MKNTIKVILAFLAGAFLVGIVFANTPTQPVAQAPLRGNSDTDIYTSALTDSLVQVSSTRALILDVDSGRSYAKICLDSTTANFPVYLHLTAVTSTVATSTGNPIVSYATTNGENCMTIGKDFRWFGQVWGISATNTPQYVTIQREL